MVGRILFYFILVLVAWWILKPRRKVAPPQDAARPPASPASAALGVEEMVDCARCGMHFPASEAVRDGARVFCCTAHRDAGPKQ